MLRSVLLATTTVLAAGHGGMVTPRPRSSHGQTWDDANKCGSSNPYSKVGLRAGEYCGLGCLGDACLYYQIGCFQGCGTCSLQGKTLYPVQADLELAGCATPPEPTLGGGNATHEHELRTNNVDNDSHMGDWTKWMPWRSPGSAGRGNPNFQPCGVNSGALASQPEPPTTAQDVPNGGNGTALPALPRAMWSTWQRGAVVEAEWSIYANHGGGYSYRLCKKVEGEVPTEECFQQTPLNFATPTTEIRYHDGSRPSVMITSPTTSVGTFPTGSQWRKNPVPMCNCDLGFNCKASQEEEDTKEEPASDVAAADFEAAVAAIADVVADVKAAVGLRGRKLGKTCTANPTCQAGGKSFDAGCKSCAGGQEPAWSCGECCDGYSPVEIAGGMYCKSSSPSPKPKPSGAGMTTAYPTTNFRPGQTSDVCPTGVQFPTYWDDGVGPSYRGKGGKGGLGTFPFTMVDRLQVPANLPTGEYHLSWRWDCEETPQVWNSCADVVITA